MALLKALLDHFPPHVFNVEAMNYCVLHLNANTSGHSGVALFTRPGFPPVLFELKRIFDKTRMMHSAAGDARKEAETGKIS